MLSDTSGKTTAIRVPTKDADAKAVIKCGNVRANTGLVFDINVEVKRAD